MTQTHDEITAILKRLATRDPASEVRHVLPRWGFMPPRKNPLPEYSRYAKAIAEREHADA